MKTILLTGATGFVGSQILAHLAKKKDVQVRLIVRQKSEQLYRDIANIENIITTNDLFEENDSYLNNACKNIDVLIHAAWYVEPGKYLESPLNINCLNGTLSLAKAAAQTGVKRFVGLGTCFEYDLGSGILSTSTPLNPITPYAAAKAAAFIFLSKYFAAANISFCWCRLFYLYGNGEDERRLVAYIKSRLSKGEVVNLSSGEQIRDFLNVTDAAKSIVDKAFIDKSGPINICSGTGITVREMAEKIADQYDRRDLLAFGTRKENLVDPPIIIGVP
jgi:nucleoside-diphosphate-sugar epimerase